MTAATPPTTLAGQLALHRAGLVAGLSRWIIHQIRTPLQAVTLLGELAREAPHQPPDRELLQSLADSSLQIETAVDQLDRLLRPAELRPPEPTVIADAAELAVGLAGLRSSRLSAELDPGLRSLAAAVAVPGLLEHIFLELVFNAHVAVGERGGRIVIAGGAVGDDIVVTVVDTGPGFADRSGDAFAPGVSAAGRAGLGLPVARGLAREWGGDLAAAAGEGGRLRLTLRRWTRPADPASAGAPGSGAG